LGDPIGPIQWMFCCSPTGLERTLRLIYPTVARIEGYLNLRAHWQARASARPSPAEGEPIHLGWK